MDRLYDMFGERRQLSTWPVFRESESESEGISTAEKVKQFMQFKVLCHISVVCDNDIVEISR